MPLLLAISRKSSRMGEQEQISSAAEFDLTICIVWSRLGPLPEPTLKMLGWQYARLGERIQSWSGVRPRQKEQRGAAIKRLPELFAIRRRLWSQERSARSLVGSGTPCRNFLQLGKRVVRGTSTGPCHNYRSLEEFEELFRESFRRFLAGQVRSKMSGKRFCAGRCADGNQVRFAD